MTHEWGDDEWGDGYWGGHANYTDILQAEWPYEQTRPDEDDALYDLFRAIHREFGYYEIILDVLKEQRRLQGATGKELEKLAREVGVIRETNERDDRLRFRTFVSKAATRSTGTFEDLATILDVLFGEDASKMEITSSVNEPVVEIRMPSKIIEDRPVTTDELENLLNDTIPVSDDMEIVTDETWVLGESGSQGVGRGGLL